MRRCPSSGSDRVTRGKKCRSESPTTDLVPIPQAFYSSPQTPVYCSSGGKSDASAYRKRVGPQETAWTVRVHPGAWFSQFRWPQDPDVLILRGRADGAARGGVRQPGAALAIQAAALPPRTLSGVCWAEAGESLILTLWLDFNLRGNILRCQQRKRKHCGSRNGSEGPVSRERPLAF